MKHALKHLGLMIGLIVVMSVTLNWIESILPLPAYFALLVGVVALLLAWSTYGYVQQKRREEVVQKMAPFVDYHSMTVNVDSSITEEQFLDLMDKLGQRFIGRASIVNFDVDARSIGFDLRGSQLTEVELWIEVQSCVHEFEVNHEAG